MDEPETDSNCGINNSPEFITLVQKIAKAFDDELLAEESGTFREDRE